MAGGFMSQAQTSLRQNRSGLKSVKSRKDFITKSLKTPAKKSNSSSSKSSKIHRSKFMQESRDERKKVSVFLFVLLVIALLMGGFLILFTE